MGESSSMGKDPPHTEAQHIRKPQHQELPAFHPPKPHTSPLLGMDIFRESEEWDSKIYTKHTTHEPCIHSKKHRRRRWDGCPFGARPPAPRRHHAPTNISREATARPGRPGTPGAPDSSQTRGAIKSVTPPLTFLRPTIHNFASQDELCPKNCRTPTYDTQNAPKSHLF